MKRIKLLYGLEAAGGGALKHVVYLATRLNKKVFDITVILSDSRGEDLTEPVKKMKDAGAKVSLIPMSRNVNPIQDLQVLFKLVFLIRKEKFDLVHAHSSKAGALFRLAAFVCRVQRIYYTPHCFYFQGKTGFKKTCFVLLEKLLGTMTTGVIVSENEQQSAIQNKVITDSKLININNAIDFDDYRQNHEIEHTKTALGIHPKAFIVGSVGRLVPQKDWETYVYAAKEVLKFYPQTVFLIVGEGELHTKIQKLIFQLNLERKVLITGYVKEIYKIYGMIDLFVNTSLWEGLPYVFLEAMRYRKPIVATDTGNKTVILDQENGFICAQKDYQGIAEKIISLVRDRKMAEQMGEKGRWMVCDKYSFKVFIQQHERLYLNSLCIPGLCL
jgi:glycosyltransferase involved in cell wall biosynthesis